MDHRSKYEVQAGSTAILDLPKEDPEGVTGAVTAATATAARASAPLRLACYLQGLRRSPPPLSRCSRRPLPGPDAPAPARKAAQPPATPQVTRAFRSVHPAEASSPGSPRAGCREDREPWPRAGGAAGRALSGHGEPGVAVGAAVPGLPGLPWGARVSPRCARRSLRSSSPSGELRGVPGRVRSASPSPPPRRDRAAWPHRRALSPRCRARRLQTTPAVFIPASRAALQPTKPRRGSPRPVGRFWP